MEPLDRSADPRIESPTSWPSRTGKRRTLLRSAGPVPPPAVGPARAQAFSRERLRQNYGVPEEQDSAVFLVEEVLGDSLSRCGVAASGLESFDDAMTTYMAERDIPSGALAVISDDGRLVYAKGFTNHTAYGLARQDAVKTCPTTQFRIASVSKILTAVGIMRAQELDLFGVNGLDTTMAELGILRELGISDSAAWTFFAEKAKSVTGAGTISLQTAFESVTIRDLLTHVSGMRDARSSPPAVAQTASLTLNIGSPYSWYKEDEQVAKVFGSLPVTTLEVLILAVATRLTPRTTWWNYSNTGFMLLGRILQKVTGRGYESWIKEHVLYPCGAYDTVLGDTDSPKAEEVAYFCQAWPWESIDGVDWVGDAEIFDDLKAKNSYDPSVMDPDQPTTYNPDGYVNIRMTEGGGGWVSTVYDLARVMRNLFALADAGTEARVLPGQAVKDMCTAQATGPSYTQGLGFNLGWYTSHPTTDRGRSGHWEGTQARLYHRGSLSKTGGVLGSGYGYVTLFNRYYDGWDTVMPAGVSTPATDMESYFHSALNSAISAVMTGATPPTDDLWSSVK